MNRLSGLLGSFGVVLATLAGCGGSDLVLPGNGTPADLRVVKGDNQIGLAGSPLAEPLEVKVVDDRGDPLSGHTVVFALDTDAPGARLDPESARSARDGIAQSRWTLGATIGTQRVVARVTPGGSAEPLEARFTAAVEAGTADQIARVSGDDQSAEVGTRVADPLVVSVTDQFGNPVQGVSVDWTAAEGSVDPASSVTGSDGRASTLWTLGPGEGRNTLNAVVSGVGVVGFSATATNGGGGTTPSRLEFLVQPTDTERGKRISPPVEVVVLDQLGNRVPDPELEIKLELSPNGGGGKLKGHRSQRTQAGVARFSDLEVDREGEYLLRASADGLPSVESNRFEVKND